MRRVAIIIWALLVLICRAKAAEQPSDAYAAIASELFQSLKKDETVAIQPLSEEETKVPMAILRSIESGLTSALQRASGFEIKLIARDRLQVIWKEAREFQKRKFEDMVAEAGADVLLIGEVRPNADGVEISYRAFRIKGGGTGTVIASSKPRVMAMDWKKELGVQPTQISDAMKEMAEAMKRLAASGGLVAEPKSPADYYHNARTLAQRGEADLAMVSYEQLFKFPITYADPVEDLMSLATRAYGRDGARLYLDKKLKPVMSKELYLFASQLAADELLLEVETVINGKENAFPPLAAAFLIAAKPSFGDVNIPPSHYDTRTALIRANNVVRESYEKGKFQTFYLDQLRGEKAAKESLSWIGPIAARNEFSFDSAAHIYYDFFKNTGKIEAIFVDYVDLSKSVGICYLDLARRKFCSELTKPRSIRESVLEYEIKLTGLATRQFLCVVELSYTDDRGVFHRLDADQVNWTIDPKRNVLMNASVSQRLRQVEGLYSTCMGETPSSVPAKN